MKKTVNLDAMIVREDFKVEAGYSQINRVKQIKASDLQFSSAMRTMIRKPDFQRETSDWNVAQVSNFISSILDRHFIPSIILWQNHSALTFVIDGAHRLSAFMAWINDDYGDGDISFQFYGNGISQEQKDFAKKARTQIEKSIGKYSMYVDALRNQQKYDDKIVNMARGLESFSFDIQWIDGDVSVAEKSFFNINQKAVPINSTELMILESRNKAKGIATRAISYSGTGYKYWKNFSSDNQKRIEELSIDINNILFLPSTKTPVTTLDVPMAGNNRSNLQLIVDIITYTNNNISDEDDNTGDETIRVLNNLFKVLQVINSKDCGSLGLHPIIYFYSKKGNFKPAFFYATVLFVKELKEKRKFNDFISIRDKFENFIYIYDFVLDQINRNLRTSKKSAEAIKEIYFEIMKKFIESCDEKIILKEISKEYKGINLQPEEDDDTIKEFNSNRKSETYILSAIPGAIKCGICGGIIHTNSTSVDHIIRKRDGGSGSATNGQITHPYCNTGYKS